MFENSQILGAKTFLDIQWSSFLLTDAVSCQDNVNATTGSYSGEIPTCRDEDNCFGVDCGTETQGKCVDGPGNYTCVCFIGFKNADSSPSGKCNVPVRFFFISWNIRPRIQSIYPSINPFLGQFFTHVALTLKRNVVEQSAGRTVGNDQFFSSCLRMTLVRRTIA